MNEELISHLDLILILILICGHVGNFLLSPNSVHSPLKRLLLVLDGLLETANSLGPLLLVLINLHHDLFKFHLGLDSILLGFPLLLGLFSHDVVLGLH